MTPSSERSSSERSLVSSLQALIAAIKTSPIIAWVRCRAPAKTFGDWATVRKSKDVDAYVLAWIASHVRDRAGRRALH